MKSDPKNLDENPDENENYFDEDDDYLNEVNFDHYEGRTVDWDNVDQIY